MLRFAALEEQMKINRNDAMLERSVHPIENSGAGFYIVPQRHIAEHPASIESETYSPLQFLIVAFRKQRQLFGECVEFPPHIFVA